MDGLGPGPGVERLREHQRYCADRQNTFSVSANGDDTRTLGDTRTKTHEAAQAKCQSMGKTMQVISDKNERTAFGGGVFPKHTLNFRCL